MLTRRRAIAALALVASGPAFAQDTPAFAPGQSWALVDPPFPNARAIIERIDVYDGREVAHVSVVALAATPAMQEALGPFRDPDSDMLNYAFTRAMHVEWKAEWVRGVLIVGNSNNPDGAVIVADVPITTEALAASVTEPSPIVTDSVSAVRFFIRAYSRVSKETQTERAKPNAVWGGRLSDFVRGVYKDMGDTI